MQKRCKEGVNDIETFSIFFPYPRSFVERDIENADAVQLAVTATVSEVEEHSEKDGLTNDIPEIRRTLLCLVLFEDLFNIVTGYQRIVSTPGGSPSPAAMPQDYAVVQAHEGQAIHDEPLLPNPKFFTITPASPDIPPYLRLIHPTS